MDAVICYRDDYLDVVGPTMDTIRYPLINKIILHIRLAFQLFAGQAILLLEHTKIKHCSSCCCKCWLGQVGNSVVMLQLYIDRVTKNTLDLN